MVLLNLIVSNISVLHLDIVRREEVNVRKEGEPPPPPSAPDTRPSSPGHDIEQCPDACAGAKSRLVEGLLGGTEPRSTRLEGVDRTIVGHIGK